jgi:type 1 glutamine amidotransferase
MSAFDKDDSIRVAVVTGAHPYDVLGFHGLFNSLGGVVPYIQHMDDFTSSSDEIRNGYDVVLFYTMLKKSPDDEAATWYQGKPMSALASLCQGGQGILVLHHAILAFPEWQLWSDLVGIEDRSFGYHIGQNIHVDIGNAEHPITAGLSPWDMIDETYTMADASEGSVVLLSVAHEKSMKHIAWTRQYEKSRVFCFQSGHDNDTWVDSNFREVLRRGLLWCAGRI